tara:strand:- start:18 stop:215 length:198 start_codon:yes stop_codon:yes gene_type:complete
VSNISKGTLLIFQFTQWTEQVYMAVVLEIAVDPFLTQGKEIYYIYMSTGESLFVTEDEIIIKEII